MENKDIIIVKFIEKPACLPAYLKKEKKKKINISGYIAPVKDTAWITALSGLAAMVIVFLIELLWRGTSEKTFEFINNSPASYWVSVLAVGLIIEIVTFICGRFWISYILAGGAFFIAGFANMYKYIFRGEVMTAAELKIIREAAKISAKMDMTPPKIALYAGGIFFAALVIFILCRPPKFTIRQRVLGIVILTALNAVQFNMVRTPGSLEYFKMGTVFLPNEVCQQNGLVLSIEGGIPKKAGKPEGYSKHTILKIMPKVKSVSEEKPNIIFVMNEAFFDINSIENLKLSKNPISNFERLQRRYVSGYIYTPVSGGGTCQTEYEVLSGYSTESTGGEIAYTKYVQGEFPSIASMLRDEGYETLAIHPYEKTFFMRNTAYPALGFDRFIGMEDMENPSLENNFISDRYTYDVLIDEIEKSEEPMFVHIVTMQNHGGYWYGYNKHNVKVRNKDLTSESFGGIQTYANLLRESDIALNSLINHFKKVKEPTYIVFFGDHAPALGTGLNELGFLSSEPESILKQYKTPFLIWSNVDGMAKENLGNINAYQLGAIAMRYANVNIDSYYEFLCNMTVHGVKGFYELGENAVPIDELPENMSQELHNRWLLQYDRMFGKGYSKLK